MNKPPDEPPQFDLREGERRRDAGIALVGDNNDDWKERALLIVCKYAPRNREFMAEEFKGYPGIGWPRHSNAWGALSKDLIKLGFMIPTGAYGKSESPTNHAHKYPIYRWVTVGELATQEPEGTVH